MVVAEKLEGGGGVSAYYGMGIVKRSKLYKQTD